MIWSGTILSSLAFCDTKAELPARMLRSQGVPDRSKRKFVSSQQEGTVNSTSWFSSGRRALLFKSDEPAPHQVARFYYSRHGKGRSLTWIFFCSLNIRVHCSRAKSSLCLIDPWELWENLTLKPHNKFKQLSPLSPLVHFSLVLLRKVLYYGDNHDW